jgi:hypothetical protein
LKQNEALKQSIAKKPTGQKLIESTSINQESCLQQQSDAENKLLRQKLLSKEEEIDEKTEIIQRLTSELDTEKAKNEKLESSIKQFSENADYQKLLAIGLNIVNTLAKPTDLINLNVIEDQNSEEDDSEMVCYFISITFD